MNSNSPSTSNNQSLESKLDVIANNLADAGYVILQDFLSEELAKLLQHQAQTLSETDFKPASIGRNQDQQLNSKVRSDRSLWLNKESETQRQYLDFMEQVRVGLNRRLFMGLFDFECHFSHYQPGDFYLKHLDAFKGRSNRALSTVYYLNPSWQESFGGELVLYSSEQDSSILTRIKPVFNQCVIFLSDSFPHEVLVSHKDRFSIAGWFRLNNSNHNHVDPAL
ncbi:2OG-Fe(II) oxygenase [Paraglaciecola aquimarina]|uniref:2OG-Fe(II) oxygenase n=1 Tax=Paraglaciecola algarum TaxID=3050085 RepID=A0ABS9D8U7_9ALTE|nr:2OG-Fe(II) oxygenase [Paraglaciecola sp. G1-23]MCF2949349.1 2OG-Fe(II) oxygenase [Paraglaciecola sp. G1-23]